LTHAGVKERIGKNTIIEPGAIVSRNALIGENCHIHAGAVVMGYSCIGNGTEVRRGAKVFDSIVWAAEQFSQTVVDEVFRSVMGDGQRVAIGTPSL
jgi:mannose-1-phosphate guanylyltransferase